MFRFTLCLFLVSVFSSATSTSRKSLSGGFRNTFDYLAKYHEQISAASNIEILVEDRKESFKNIETYIYSFFGVSVKLIYNHSSDSAQTLVLTCVKHYLRRAVDKNTRYKVLEMDPKGNLYFHKTAFLCKNDLIKRLVRGKYHLVESSSIGLSKDSAALNCKDLKTKVPSATSGVYWIDPDAGSHSNAFQAYCDQQTDGGGWTLVWSYTFTAYSSFTSSANAVTPRPTWTASSANTRVSTTVPLSETHYEAMNFALWRTIGKEFLIKSNINNWIACKEGSGSLVMQKSGSLSCKLVKQVSKQCAGVVPKSITMHSHGPYLDSARRSHFYYFDGSTSGHWPPHDPCGRNQANQVKGVVNPHGNIFVR